MCHMCCIHKSKLSHTGGLDQWSPYILCSPEFTSHQRLWRSIKLKLPARFHHNPNSLLNTFRISKVLPCYLKPYRDPMSWKQQWRSISSCRVQLLSRVFDKNFDSAPNWLKNTCQLQDNQQWWVHHIVFQLKD